MFIGPYGHGEPLDEVNGREHAMITHIMDRESTSISSAGIQRQLCLRWQ